MKHILMIATGGTIASKETADGLAPQLTSEELLAEVMPSSGRMNTPGVAEGNWHWQLKDGQLTFDIARWLAKVCRESGR